MRTEAGLLGRVGRNEAHRECGRGFRAPVSCALLDLRQLAAQPDLVGRSIEDQHPVAGPQILVVILPNLGLVSLEDRMEHFEVLEQGIGPGRDRGCVALVVHEIELRGDGRGGRRLGPGRSRWLRLDRDPLVDHRLQLLERRLEEVGGVLHALIHPEPFDDAPLTLVVDGEAARDPDQARQRAMGRLLDGQFVLDLEERHLTTLWNEPVLATEHVNRQPAAGEILPDVLGGFGSGERHRARGQHRVPPLLQCAPHGVALRAEVARGLGEIHGSAGGLVPAGRLAQQLEQRVQVVRQIVELHPEVPFGFRPEDLVQFTEAPGAGDLLEELVTEQRLQFRRLFLQRDRGLENLEEARLVPDLDAALPIRRATEPLELLTRGPGLDVARRDDRHQRADAFELLPERLAEDVVAAQLGIPPDLGLLAEQLRHADFERPLKVRDPAPATLYEADVVQMCVADEGIAFEIDGHVRDHLTGSGAGMLDTMRNDGSGPAIVRGYARGSWLSRTPAGRLWPRGRRKESRLGRTRSGEGRTGGPVRPMRVRSVPRSRT
jgi:hypothetical protein